MVVLSQSLISQSSGKPYTDPEAVPPDLVHNSSLHLTFAKYETHTHMHQANLFEDFDLCYVLDLCFICIYGVPFSATSPLKDFFD